MDQKAIIKCCKELGCCDICCLRYSGLKSPKAYENPLPFLNTNQEKEDLKEPLAENGTRTAEINSKENGNSKESSSPLSKRKKTDICISCLGILQKENWPECCTMVKEELDRKQYECETFACALSAPVVMSLREKTTILRLKEAFPEYDASSVTVLKEAWKWSFGPVLAEAVGKTLDSGAVCPLLVSVTFEYPDDALELEVLKTVSADSWSKQRGRGGAAWTRRGVEEALAGLEGGEGAGLRPPAPGVAARVATVATMRSPLYLGGRYIKLSRSLPQTPWMVAGKRMMESSVQEIIFGPIAKLYNMSPSEAESRLKLVAAGREDVDVRCLGDGRPFAIEILDPRRELTSAELAAACADISAGGEVAVHRLVPVSRDDLALLKKGEETKTKTYEALCIKLKHCDDDEDKTGLPVVTSRDIDRINSYRNTPIEDPARVVLQQRTPIRVLHRRPLLTRTRRILELSARVVEGHTQLFVVRLRTEAGTYVKEWAHGELRRSRPALGAALGAPADLLALDVAAVDLPWPNVT